jgi:hypothetical protein
MLQGIKVVAGLLAGIMLILIVSALVWTVTTVRQLTKDTSRLEQVTQKLADSSGETTVKINAIETKGFENAKEVKNVRKDVDALNTEVGELITATGRQFKDIKSVIVEQSLQLDDRISGIEQKNEEYGGKIEELNRRLTPQKPMAVAPKPANTPSGRIFVDINNPNGPADWADKYTVQLHAVAADKQNFLIDWYKPFCCYYTSPNKPEIVKKTPKFKYAAQLYFFLNLGDAADNRIIGVIDYEPTDKKYFPFDLYLDKDRDGDLAEDKVPIDSESEYHVRGVKVSYKDGLTEEYFLHIYAVQTGGKISVWYGPEAGRYGVLEAGKKRIQILILDSSGNGLFNDADDEILMDWNLDGVIDGSSDAGGERELYSDIELPGGKYRITEIDPIGHHLTLSRMH